MSRKTMRASRRRRDRQPSARVWWLLGSGILLALAAVFFAVQAQNPGGETEIPGTPRLAADKQAVDLGDVRLGQTVTVTFDLSNDGDGTLHFQEAPYVEVVEGC